MKGARLNLDYVPAGPVARDFHLSPAFVRGLMGPVGSSKSSACCMEIFIKACAQEAHVGVRRTRWAVLRNTYGELKSTTIRTWQQWFPEEIAPIKWDSPISSILRLPMEDGTRVECEVLFFPLDRPEEVGKLRSLELTGAFMNESSEMAKVVLDMLTQRVGRFPAIRDGGATWSGVFMDTNPPDDDSWYYRVAEKDNPKGWEFFRQPGGMVLRDGQYFENPEAENVANLPGGFEYYKRMLAGKDNEWIKVFVLGQYGTITNNRPVYPEWNEELHVRDADPDPKLPLIIGFDFGLTPAAVIGQVSAKGRLVIVDELFAKDIGINQFARDVLKPHLSVHYPKYKFACVGDPAGIGRSQNDEKTAFMELAEAGFACVPASTNAFVGRRESVAKYLTRLVDGKAAFALSPKCDMLRRGFMGRYGYKRLQVVGEERYRDVADKNDFSHPHDALQYLCLYTQTMGDGSEWATAISYPKKTGVV